MLKDLYASKGIQHPISYVQCPQQNRRVERRHQQILNTAKAILTHLNIPKIFWCYGVAHVVYIINRFPSKGLGNCSPHGLFFHIIPDVNDFKSFGCLCYSSNLYVNKKELDNRAEKCIFLRLKSRIKGFILYDIKNRETFLSRNVVFYENSFSYKNSNERDSYISAPIDKEKDFLLEPLIPNATDSVSLLPFQENS